jgi:hypothetical protein
VSGSSEIVGLARERREGKKKSENANSRSLSE